jgi:exopolysaccharide production protein ExoQ
MRISKSSLVEPGRNTLYGAFAVAVSFFVFAYSFRIGQISILMYYAVWLPLVLVDYRFTLGRLARSPQLLAFAFLACLSYFWSDAPDVTLRAALQYLTHVVCAVIAARVIDARTLCIGAIAGIAVILGYSMLQAAMSTMRSTAATASSAPSVPRTSSASTPRWACCWAAISRCS